MFKWVVFAECVTVVGVLLAVKSDGTDHWLPGLLIAICGNACYRLGRAESERNAIVEWAKRELR